MNEQFVRRSFDLTDNSALDRHAEANSDPAVLAEIEEIIRANGVEYIYYQLPTLGSRVVAKVVPAVHFRKTFRSGVFQHRTSMTDLQTTRTGALIGGGVGAQEFVALPDPETFTVLPWDTSVARVFCSAYEPNHLPGVGGRPLATDSRAAMRRVHAEFEDHTGFHVRSGCEPEMSWEGAGLEVIKKDGASPAYQVENLEIMRPVYQKLIRYGQAMGLDMIQGDYEDDGQLELNWNYDRIELTADRLVTYRQICRQVGRELGITASFMPKPYVGQMGNGCHHNLSVWENDDNLLIERGNRELHISPIGKQLMGGIIENAADMMGVMASTVNSYKRFWDVGQFAPDVVNWGLDDRSCLVRISSIGRMEYRVPDSAVNPYLSHALIVGAYRAGLDGELDPGEPVDQAADREAASGTRVPTTLGDAISLFDRSGFVRSVLPDLLVDHYAELKCDEWARFCGAITDWERDQYWETVP
ncbi:glutamine synthetase [Brevibacterium luteolum]|uniref:Glutamine synthetase n=2 Tax=Brevibacterium luteolum TaxID=199591 RepID=A0A849AP20_9MICO|nr:glutamine synthetase [Brevibacterium luteolum]